jgi:glutamate-1-semialdehyde 2,1-aminomutase
MIAIAAAMPIALFLWPAIAFFTPPLTGMDSLGGRMLFALKCCCRAKIIGGGFPLAAVAGRKPIMDHFDKAIAGPERWLMMLGTLSGNPIAAVAGLKTLEILGRDGAYDKLKVNGERVMATFHKHLEAAAIPHRIVGHPTLFEVLFTKREVRNYRDVQKTDVTRGA